jgi:hypothetical protein
VFVRDKMGHYLAGGQGTWYFTDDRSKAVVFDYLADHVAEQMKVIYKTNGLALGEEPVPLEEIYETCDQCRELVMPFMTFFDGKRFLCADCRKALSKRRPGTVR